MIILHCHSSLSLNHWTVFCSVTWPLNDSEAGGDIVWYRPHSLFCCVNKVVLMLTSLHLNEKNREVCVKARSLPASLAFIGQVTKHNRKIANWKRLIWICSLKSSRHAPVWLTKFDLFTRWSCTFLVNVSSNISWIFLVFSLPLAKGERIFSFNEEIVATGEGLGDSAMGPE